MITIKLNKKLDCETYHSFKSFKVAGVDFGEKIKNDHPDITSNNYQQYIDNFYSLNKDLLGKNCQEINAFLGPNQTIFFTELKKLFGLDFSSNDYTGYLSIFNCNPRYVENKTFQIFYKKDLLDKVEVAFHESLHFALFAYCDQFLEKTKELNKNSGPLWELSEIFNVIVLNLPQFQVILKRPEQLFYPNLKEKLEKMNNIWAQNKDDLQNFVKEGLLL